MASELQRRRKRRQKQALRATVASAIKQAAPTFNKGVVGKSLPRKLGYGATAKRVAFKAAPRREPGVKPRWQPKPERLPTIAAGHPAISQNYLSARAKQMKGGVVPRRVPPSTRNLESSARGSGERRAPPVRAKLARVGLEGANKPLPVPHSKRSATVKSALSASATAPRRQYELSDKRLSAAAAHANTCKPRPRSSKSKGGGSRAFVPWCDRRR